MCLNFLSVNANGTFSYQAAKDYFGADSFTYKVNDGELDSAIATVSLTVTPVNDAPVAADVAVTVLEDNTVAITLLATDVDTASASLQFVIVTQPQNGTLIRNADGSYSYVGKKDFSGADSFTYKVNDGELESNLATVRITVTAVNDAPTLADQALTVAEDTLLNGNLLATAADVDNPVLTAAIVAGPMHGTVTVNANGTFSYQAAKDYFGADSFTYRVNDGASDGALDSGIATVSLTVTPVNDAPVAADVAVTVLEDNTVAITLLAADVDNTAPELQFDIKTGPSNGSLVKNADGTYSYTPAANFFGVDSFTYTVSDGSLTSNVAMARITITAVNDAPVANDLMATLAEDGSVVLNLMASASDADVGDGDLLTLTTSNAQSGSVVKNANGTYTYVPVANFNGTDSFSYTVSDGKLLSTAMVRLTITAVNDAPVAANDTAVTDQGKAVRIAVLANDVDVDNDVDGDTLTARVVSNPANGVVSTNADGSLTYTPNAGFFGTDSFTYVAHDGQANSNLASVTITVNATNRAPVFTSTPPASIELNTTAPVAGDSVFQVAGSTGSTGSQTANFKFTQKEASYANEVGYYRVDDATGRIGNLRPGDAGYAKAALDTSRATAAFGASAAVGAAASSSVPAGQYVGFYLIQNASISSWRSNNSANALNKSPVAFFSFQAANPDNFDHLQASLDAQGKLTLRWEDLSGGGDKDFNDMVFTATGFKAASASAPTVFSYDANASDPDGDALTYSLATAPQGATIHAQTGVVSWSPTAVGNYSFSITVSDGKGGSATQTFTLAVTSGVKGPNTAPQAKDDTATVDEDNTVRINVLANDLDAQGDALTATLVAGPSYGKLVKNLDGTYSYTADANYSGTDSFTYRVSDGQAESNVATVRLVVNAVADAPTLTLTDTTVRNTGLEDSAIRLSTIKAALLDTDGSETLSISISALPVGAVLSDGAKRFVATQGCTSVDVTQWCLSTLSLTPPANFNGTLSLNVIATATEKPNGQSNGPSNAKSASSSATLVVTVKPVNDAPVAKNASYQVQKDGSVRIDFSALVSDVDGDSLSLAFAQPKYGTLTRNADGSYTYKPKRGYTGADSFGYTVSDGKLATTAKISLTVGRSTGGHDDDHDDRDCHGKQASVAVKSEYRKEGDDRDDDQDRHAQDYGYIVVRGGAKATANTSTASSSAASTSALTINWNGTAAQTTELVKANWVSDFLGSSEGQRSLAQKTGLVVKVKG